MSLLERIQAILLRPKETWPVIAAEPADTATIYSNYLVFLAAIPAIAGFIGLTLVGVGGFGASVRVPIVTGLIQLIVGYVLALVIIFVMALIVDALAYTAVVVICGIVAMVVLGAIVSTFSPSPWRMGAAPAAGGVTGGATGNRAAPIAAQDPKAMLPAALGDLKRAAS